MHPKIQKQHIGRPALLYLRQSTPKQLLEHKESIPVQLQLKEKLLDLGFSKVVVVDSDLGKSGGGYMKREGFSWILNEVCTNRAGAVASWEASRLARNNFDWQNLIRFCQITRTLVIDESGIYDPANIDDLVMLGIKGTMCEYELHMLTKRARAGLYEKARRGELYTVIAVGYHLNEDGHLEKYPHERVQKTLDLIFKKFEEFTSARQVLIWLLEKKIDIPKIRYYHNKRTIIWQPPVYGSILAVLNNPVYAGAYAYGQSEAHISIHDNDPVKTKGHPLPMESWKVLLLDHHEGYISWDRYIKNQNQLKENAQRIPQVKGAAKMGCGLLSGLIDCGHCGKKLRVRYSGRDHKSVTYYCPGDSNKRGENKNCITLNGKKIETALVQELLKVIKPAAIQASFEAEKRIAAQNSEYLKMLELELEQAKYECDRHKRQFDAVEPENSLVIREVQQHWNESIANVDRLEDELEKEKSKHKSFHSIDQEYLYSLSKDLPRLWNLPSTDDRSRKRIIRTLIKKINAKYESDHDRIDLTIYWAGGVHSQFSFKHHRLNRQTSKEALEIIKEMSVTSDDSTIARILNRVGIPTGSGLRWNKLRVASIRKVYEIPPFSNIQNSNKLNLIQAANQLDVSEKTIKRLIKAGSIHAKQTVKYAPWIIDKSELEKPAVLKAAEAIKKRGKLNLQINQQELQL
jgi:DNA invertase Pin-like site-specific DNA recombinase